MKTKLSIIALFAATGIFVSFLSCQVNSKGDKTEDKVTLNQKDLKQQLQGVFEYLPPNQGMAAMYKNNFFFIFGDSDTSMVCQKGTLIVSGDTVIFTTEYSTDPELIGSTIKWSPVFMENDSLKTIIYDEEGKNVNEFYNIRKVKVDEHTISQMKKFEGLYQYGSNQGGGILISGYGVYIGGSSGGAGIYTQKKDTVTFKRLFSTNPDLVGEKIIWVNESMSGDTLNWATINDAGEVLSRGQSVYLRH